MESILFFEHIKRDQFSAVGGKLFVLGELFQKAEDLGIVVPPGFTVITTAYREHLQRNGLEGFIYSRAQLAREDEGNRARLAAEIRQAIIESPVDEHVRAMIMKAYRTLCGGRSDCAVAVRSSATAEDLPTASFAGQQDSYLSIVGDDAVCDAVRQCWASLFTERALTYRALQSIDERAVAIAVGVQLMVDVRSAGVAFTIEPTTGNPDFVAIESAHGVGENIVQGLVRPDTFLVHKKTLNAQSGGVVCCDRGSDSAPSLSAQEAAEIARVGGTLERAYGYALDCEWAIDKKGSLFILQARPETVFSQRGVRAITRYVAAQPLPVPLCDGSAVGKPYAMGRIRHISHADSAHDIQPGEIIVTRMTQPDWLPILRKAAGIITDEGGRTCHAAIVSRELGIPALVGTGNGTKVLPEGMLVTIFSEGGLRGAVYEGALEVTERIHKVGNFPTTYPPVQLIAGDPAKSLDTAQLPVAGVGLARIEFIIAHRLGIHPCAARDDRWDICDPSWDSWREKYPHLKDAYVARLAEEVALLAAPFYPRPVIVRFGDFKSNEYRNLAGGDQYEPMEENPMLGLRGAARYIHPQFKDAFAYEIAAMKQVHTHYGLTNVQGMVPFVRTVSEARAVCQILDSVGFSSKNGFLRWMMVELPVNVLILDQFAPYFDGFSIGSNDLTQLTLGIDRDSGYFAQGYDERNDAVKVLIGEAIRTARAAGKPIGICGQAPSDHPDLRDFLISSGISSMSMSYDAVLDLLAMFPE